MCSIMAMSLLYELTLWSNVCEGPWIQWFRDQDAAIPNGWLL
jgi:hypothetical protein